MALTIKDGVLVDRFKQACIDGNYTQNELLELLLASYSKQEENTKEIEGLQGKLQKQADHEAYLEERYCQAGETLESCLKRLQNKCLEQELKLAVDTGEEQADKQAMEEFRSKHPEFIDLIKGFPEPTDEETEAFEKYITSDKGMADITAILKHVAQGKNYARTSQVDVIMFAIEACIKQVRPANSNILDDLKEYKQRITQSEGFRAIAAYMREDKPEMTDEEALQMAVDTIHDAIKNVKE